MHRGQFFLADSIQGERVASLTIHCENIVTRHQGTSSAQWLCAQSILANNPYPPNEFWGKIKCASSGGIQGAHGGAYPKPIIGYPRYSNYLDNYEQAT